MNPNGATLKTLKFGYKWGDRSLISFVPVGASEVFTNTGGKFCWFDTSRRLEVAGDGNNPDSGAFIAGWVEEGAFTASSTEGATKVTLDVSCQSVYRIPANAAVTAAYRLKSCDLVTTSNVQYANVSTATEKYLIIVDVDIANQCVYVHMNPAAVYITAVA